MDINPSHEYESSKSSIQHQDEELERAVKELLHNSQKLDASDITVTADNRNIKLSGSVHSQRERDYALSLARLVQNIGEVTSEIIVKTNEGILPTDIGRNPH